MDRRSPFASTRVAFTRQHEILGGERVDGIVRARCSRPPSRGWPRPRPTGRHLGQLGRIELEAGSRRQRESVTKNPGVTPLGLCPRTMSLPGAGSGAGPGAVQHHAPPSPAGIRAAASTTCSAAALPDRPSPRWRPGAGFPLRRRTARPRSSWRAIGRARRGASEVVGVGDLRGPRCGRLGSPTDRVTVPRAALAHQRDPGRAPPHSTPPSDIHARTHLATPAQADLPERPGVAARPQDHAVHALEPVDPGLVPHVAGDGADPRWRTGVSRIGPAARCNRGSTTSRSRSWNRPGSNAPSPMPPPAQREVVTAAASRDGSRGWMSTRRTWRRRVRGSRMNRPPHLP